MKGVMEGNDFRFERAMAHAGIMTRQFKSGFVRFGAGIHKQHALGKRGVDQFTSQTQRRFIGKNVTGMPQGFPLGFQRLDQRRMAMAQRSHCNPAGEIDILFALLIPYAAAFTFDRNKVRRCINRQNHLIKSCARNSRLFSCHIITTRLSRKFSEIILTKYE